MRAAMDRVRSIEQALQGLRPGSPGSPGGQAFSQVLAAATAPVASPAVVQPSAGASGSGWTSAVQRPALLGGHAALASPTAPVSAEADAVYRNGEVPESALVPIGGGERLQADAAHGFVEMRTAAARDGVELRVNDSYRSLAEQREMAARKGLYSQGGLAARPGTSTHGVGRSVDLHLDPAAQQWMRRNAARFGYANDVDREPWHWTFTDAG